MCNLSSDVIPWQIYDFLSDGKNNVCSLTLYEVFAKQEKCQNFDLDNGGQSQ